jgi:hypothetical protein
MKSLILTKTHLILVVAFVLATALNGLPPNQAFAQITDQKCSGCRPCPGDLTCYKFPGQGARCAASDPCSYYECPDHTTCHIAHFAMAEICPDGRHVGVPPMISCQCMGSNCPSGGEGTVSYDVTTQPETVSRPTKRARSIQANAVPGFDPGRKGALTEILFDAEEMAGTLENKSCAADDDCQLIDEELGLACCWAGQCDLVDYALDKWIAVNSHWFSEQRKLKCPSEFECGPAPMCPVRMKKSNFRARCIKGLCQKSSK